MRPALHRAHDEAGQVVLAGRTARHLRGLAADQRAAVFARQPARDRRSPAAGNVGVQLPTAK